MIWSLIRDFDPVGRDRAVMFLGIFLTPVTGWILRVNQSEAFDPWPLRNSVLLVQCTLFLGTFLIPWFRKNTPWIVFIGMALVISHFFLLIPLNSFSFSYSMGGIAAAVILLNMATHRLQLIGLGALILSLALLVVCLPSTAQIPKAFFFLCMSTAIASSFLVQMTKFSRTLQLQDSELFKSLVIKSMSEGLVVHDHTGNIKLSNPAASRILGLSEEQILGKSPIDPSWRCVREDGKPFPGSEHPASVCLTSGNPVFGVTMGVYKPDGELTWISVTAIPVFTEQQTLPKKSTPNLVIASFTDITELKRSEQKLIEHQAQLVHSSRMSALGMMAAGVAHEINNPLAIIKGLVNRLISITKKEPLGLIPPTQINCRSIQICQVLLNLLNNSCDAVEPLTEKWIAIDFFQFPDKIQIQVTDSGKGIPEPIAARLMSPFFTTKEIGKGTGLGLSVSKGIVEAHGGVLFFDPKYPNTRFVIELPRVNSSPEPSKA